MSIYSSISFRFRRKMSTFAGHVDRHRGVVIKSTIAATEQEKPTEFGPKLASNFLHFFFFLWIVSRTPRRANAIGSQTLSQPSMYNNIIILYIVVIVDYTSGSNRLAARQLQSSLLAT